MSKDTRIDSRFGSATIIGAALLATFCTGLNAQFSCAQSPGADVEAIDATEAPLRVDKQGPICGKLELGSVAPVPKKAVLRLPPARAAETGHEQAPSPNRLTEAAKHPADSESLSPRTVQARAATAGETTRETARFNQSGHTQEFNWLSDEPVSDTAAKFAANAKKELADKNAKNTASTIKSSKASKRVTTASEPSDSTLDVDGSAATLASNKPVTEKRQIEFSDNDSPEQSAKKQTTSNSSAASSQSKQAPLDPKAVKVAKKPHCSGVADFYADRFHGLKTASGQIHDKEKYTAAHRTLPFGTKLKVVNRNTGKACIVTVNDRGPFTPSRVIDLSSAAAKELGLITAKSRLVDCFIVENE